MKRTSAADRDVLGHAVLDSLSNESKPTIATSSSGPSSSKTDDDEREAIEARSSQSVRALDPAPSATAMSETISQATSDNDESSRTPPMPNGEVRLHPLLDEAKLGGMKSTAPELHSEAPIENEIAAKEKSIARMDAITQEASAQYPSPSSGFVPPVTEEDFSLGSVPLSARVKMAATVKGSEKPSSTTAEFKVSNEPVSIDGTEEVDVGTSSKTQARTGSEAKGDNDANATTLFHSRRMSTTSNHSQAISASSSPSTVAPQRRPSSTSVYHQVVAIPLKVRDFAFTETDPRHVGAKDVSAPSSSQERYEEGRQRWQGDDGADDDDADDDDDDDDDEDDNGEKRERGAGVEDDEDDQQQLPLPLGLYHAAYDFTAESEHELSVMAGQKVQLIGHVDGGWAIVVKLQDGKETWTAGEEDQVAEVDKGLVPEAYLEWVG
ncbi:hypothetical protein CBS101457_003884 [Exobasidium rhododendri]|nr:hypothetical protein CBS101457_003884 [Exobasidium rhododendri]